MGLVQQRMTPGRTTLLGAVNVLLTNIGEQPVDNLDNEQIQDARVAQETLLEFHKDGQTRGWSWNTEKAYPFDPDPVTGGVEVPPNAVSWAVNPYKLNGRYILRGSRVYDKLNRTYQIADTIEADVIWLLSWDESPEVYNRWTTIRAARVFAARMLGDEALVKYTAIDEQGALNELQQVEYAQAQPNSLTGGPGMVPVPTYTPELGLMRGVYGGVVS